MARGITKRKNRDGTVSYKVRVMVDGQRATKSVGSLSEAKLLLGELKYSAPSVGPRSMQVPRSYRQNEPDESPLIEVAIEQYLSCRSALLRRSTLTNMAHALQVLAKLRPNQPVHRLTVTDLVSYQTAVQKKFKGGTPHLKMACLKTFLKWCRKRGWTDLTFSDLEPLPSSPVSCRYLLPDELSRLFAVAARTNKHFHRLIQLALYTGCRRSELVDLTTGEVRLNSRTIHLPAARMKARRERVILLSNGAVDVLARQLACGSGPGERVFPWGTFPYALWNRVRKEAMVKQFRWHDLRHSAASYLAQEGASPLDIAEFLGHNGLHTVTRYAHLSPQSRLKSASLLQDTIAARLESTR